MLREQSLCRGVVRLTAVIALLSVGTEWAVARGGGGGGGGGGHGGGGSRGGFSRGGYGGYGYGRGYGGYGYGRGYGGYGYGGYGYGRGYGGYGYGGYGYGGYGYGRGYGGYGYGGYGYGRGYYGYGYGPGYYYGYGSYPSYTAQASPYNYNTPAYYGNGMSAYYAQPSYTSAPSYSTTPGSVNYANNGPNTAVPQPANANVAVFVVRAPDANARVWFQDYQTHETGTVREFESSNLQPGKTYMYHIRARWIQNGQPLEATRDVPVQAGQTVAVDFSNVLNNEQDGG